MYASCAAFLSLLHQGLRQYPQIAHKRARAHSTLLAALIIYVLVVKLKYILQVH